MKLSNMNPTNLFKSKSKKSRSVSRSEPGDQTTSFSSQTTSSSDETSSQKLAGLSTPTTVLPHSDFDLRHAFLMIDRDGDGKITTDDLESLLRRLGGAASAPPPSSGELKRMIGEVDSDGDGCITLEEFHSSIGSAFAPPSCDSEMRETFEFFDSDRDGRISAEELFRVFETIGDAAACTLEECRRMIATVDRNGDGFVCFEDFSRMMEQQGM